MNEKNVKIAARTAISAAVVTGLFVLAVVGINYTASRLRKSLAGSK